VYRPTAMLLLFSMGILSASAWAQEFEAWEGEPVIHEGHGGTKQAVDGIDFWDRGEPPRKYKIIGYIHDRRHKSGIIGKISMSHLRADVAAAARQAGGDAVMPVSTNTETAGVVGYGHTLAGGGAIAGAHSIQTAETDFAVIQYVASANDTHPADSARKASQSKD
jgi:hypothetical protein